MNDLEEVIVGLMAEQRFIDVINSPKSGKPEWLKRASRANLYFDAVGVDAFCVVQRSDGKKVAVPVQIKSSVLGMYRYYAEDAARWFYQVPVFVVNDSRTDESLLEMVTEKLISVYNGEDDYHEFVEYCASEIAKKRDHLRRLVPKWQAERDAALFQAIYHEVHLFDEPRDELWGRL